MAHTIAPTIAIRAATADDALAVRRLAALDSSPTVPSGEMLVAVVDGRLRAALPLDGGPAIADPFQPTSELLAHLQLRAARIRSCRAEGRKRHSARRTRYGAPART